MLKRLPQNLFLLAVRVKSGIGISEYEYNYARIIDKKKITDK